MSVIFSSAPGTVVAIKGDGAAPFTISVAGDAFDAIAVSIAVDLQVSAQIQTSLQDTVHVTPFGDRPGTLSVNYVLNGAGCNVDSMDTSRRFFDSYANNRIAPSSARQQLFVIGKSFFTGFIVGARMQATAEGGLYMMTGQIQAAVWY